MGIGCYVRVSTADQSLERQLESTSEYAQNQLDSDLREIETYRDKSTGKNTTRDGYRDLLRDVEAGEIDAVVVHSVSRIARSIRDLDRTVERVVEESNAELHVISVGFELTGDDDPYQTAMLRLLGVCGARGRSSPTTIRSSLGYRGTERRRTRTDEPPR